MSENTPKDITDIAKQTVEETKNELLFDSYCELDEGISCSCSVEKIHDFHGYLPDNLCGKVLDNLYKDVELTPETELIVVEDFETECQGLCPCQRAHFFTLKFKEEVFELDRVEDGKVMDKRKLRILPNHQ